MHQKQSSLDLQDTGIDKVFFLEKSCRKMYTVFSAVQRQQRKSDVKTYFGLAACSAVYYHAGSSLAWQKAQQITSMGLPQLHKVKIGINAHKF
jgi:hypothetical protein